MTDKVLSRFKSRIESLSLAPFNDGRFEVFLGDDRIYSKKETGEFPDEGDILRALEEGG